MATMREIRREPIHYRREIVTPAEPLSFRAAQVVYTILGVMETLLLFRFAFKLFAANASNAFVSFIYNLTSPLVAPFQGIFATPREGGAIFDSAAILAMIIYAVIAYLVVRLFFVADGVEEEDVL